jgi:hypothetical protein
MQSLPKFVKYLRFDKIRDSIWSLLRRDEHLSSQFTEKYDICIKWTASRALYSPNQQNVCVKSGEHLHFINLK